MHAAAGTFTHAHIAAGHPTQAARLLADLTARLTAAGEQPEPATTALAAQLTR